MSAINLYPHQVQARDFLLSRGRAILADAPRVGKTMPTAAAAIQHLPALVVCPAVVKPGWVKAFAALGREAQEVKGKAQAKAVNAEGVVVINYDLLPDLCTLTGWQTVVIDESHRIKTPTAKRTKVAIKLMRSAPRVYALSGTPVPNRPIELWPLLHGLGIYKRSWMEFAVRYCKAWHPPWGGLDVSGASNLPELRAKLKPHVLRRKREDVFTSYQQPAVSLVELDLPVDRREKAFDADALAEAVASNPGAILAIDGLSEIMREGGERKAPLAADFVRSRIEQEPDEPLVVFAWHKSVVAMLAESLSQEPAISHVVVTGQTSASAKQQAIDDFQAGRVQVIIGNISSISEGVDLSRANTVIFAESTWQTSALEQASARVENINKVGCAPLIYILTARASLDSIVLSKVLKKAGVIEQII
jgi:SWI/SNF-related matrix-associated actin-dependent regulator of chromatin subfamily A-like protein 1